MDIVGICWFEFSLSDKDKTNVAAVLVFCHTYISVDIFILNFSKILFFFLIKDQSYDFLILSTGKVTKFMV